MVKIGHAVSNENGKASGGAAGDQTGREVCTRYWYNRPWNVILRAESSAVREKIAAAMEAACKNDNIGYDQKQRNTLLTAARKVGYNPGKVTVKCETDCSALVALCCMYAGVPETALFENGNSAYTGNLKRKLLDAGGFEALTASKYRTSDKYLKRGDILLCEGHHVAVALEDGSASGSVSVAAAQGYDKSYAGTYQTTSDLNLRSGAGTDKKIITCVKKGGKVENYGYFTKNGSTVWLYVKYGNNVGYCSSKYLVKC